MYRDPLTTPMLINLTLPVEKIVLQDLWQCLLHTMAHQAKLVGHIWRWRGFLWSRSARLLGMYCAGEQEVMIIWEQSSDVELSQILKSLHHVGDGLWLVPVSNLQVLYGC
jgi:hypothetical protein